MKRHFSVLIPALLLLAACNVRSSDKLNVSDDTERSTASQRREVRMLDSVYDFGTITEGQQVEYNFRFVNISNKMLVIEKAYASCGCTVAEKPEAPVPSGDTSFIKVVFNSKGKSGHNEKRITVLSNADPSFPILILKGEVEPVH